MNAYDFDETILKGDSEQYFFAYIFKTIPESIKYKSKIAFKRKLYKSHFISKERLYNYMYSKILKYIDNLDEFLEKFWDEHQIYVKAWYLKQQKDDDVIISATPRFILTPIMKRLNIKYLIASELDVKTGKCIGKLTYGNQKVIRYKEMYGDIVPEEFYSDSNTDIYMAKIAKKAYIVFDDEITDWNF